MLSNGHYDAGQCQRPGGGVPSYVRPWRPTDAWAWRTSTATCASGRGRRSEIEIKIDSDPDAVRIKTRYQATQQRPGGVDIRSWYRGVRGSTKLTWGMAAGGGGGTWRAR